MPDKAWCWGAADPSRAAAGTGRQRRRAEPRRLGRPIPATPSRGRNGRRPATRHRHHPRSDRAVPRPRRRRSGQTPPVAARGRRPRCVRYRHGRCRPRNRAGHGRCRTDGWRTKSARRTATASSMRPSPLYVAATSSGLSQYALPPPWLETRPSATARSIHATASSVRPAARNRSTIAPYSGCSR